jgi:hypothetical protein
MPDSVIAAVEQRAETEKQPLIVGGCPLFEWRPDQPFLPQDNAGATITVADGNGDNITITTGPTEQPSPTYRMPLAPGTPTTMWV